ncbi:Uncharacterised protein [Sphingobacterium daejeonense]|nr:Uncharacterised protein [Sphingobacterium daejeonense]
MVVGALPAFYADKAPNIKILVNSFSVYHQDRSNELLKEKIKLAPDDNNITFHYSSAEQIIEHDLKFEYKLEGFDKDWIKGSSEANCCFIIIWKVENIFLWSRCGINLEIGLHISKK